MRKVIIVRGTYGHRPAGSKHITPKTRTDPPFEVDDQEAARIVGLGIARYAADAVATPRTPPPAPNPEDTKVSGGARSGGGEDDEDEIQDAIPYYSESSNVAELRAIGKLAGLTFAVGTTKAQMIEVLDEHYGIERDDGGESDPDDEPSDDETPPKPTVEEPVT